MDKLKDLLSKAVSLSINERSAVFLVTLGLQTRSISN